MRIRYVLIAALLAAYPAYAQFSKSTVSSQISSTFPDNTTGQITPSALRTFLNNLVNSYQQYTGVNPQAGTDYQVQVSDYGQLVLFSNAAPVAITLPQATGSFATFNVHIENTGAGTVTINPVTSTIGGAASYELLQNQNAWFVSDGTNWQVAGGQVGTLSTVLGGTGLSIVNLHNIFIGAGTSPFTQLTPSSTSGIPIISNGPGSDPGYGIAVVAGGGTGVATLTSNGVLFGNGTSSAGATAAGTNGQVLTGVTSSSPVFSSIKQILALSNGAVALTGNATTFQVGLNNATEALIQAICPIAGTFKNLRVTSTTPPANTTLTNTWRIAGADTSLVCTITSSSASCNDTTHTATCNAGQPYSLKTVTSGVTGSLPSAAGGIEFDNP